MSSGPASDYASRTVAVLVAGAEEVSMPALRTASPLARFDYPHTARREMLAFLPGHCQRLLDVGCNTGAFGFGCGRGTCTCSGDWIGI